MMWKTMRESEQHEVMQNDDLAKLEEAVSLTHPPCQHTFTIRSSISTLHIYFLPFDLGYKVPYVTVSTPTSSLILQQSSKLIQSSLVKNQMPAFNFGAHLKKETFTPAL
jgi:hypothetical protein